MAQQTAVEWLAEKMEKLIPPGNQIEIFVMLDKAKQMEKEQIENAYDAGSKEIEQDKDNAAWYYFETYIKEQQ